MPEPGAALIDNLPAGLLRRGALRGLDGGDRAAAGRRAPAPTGGADADQVNVQGLTVEAALTGRREAVYQAAMLDPHTAAELSMDEIKSLVDDLLDAHGEWIPGLEPSVGAAA